MDGTIHATSAKKRTVSSVDDGVDLLFGDIALNDKDLAGHKSFRILQGIPEQKGTVVDRNNTRQERVLPPNS